MLPGMKMLCRGRVNVSDTGASSMPTRPVPHEESPVQPVPWAQGFGCSNARSPVGTRNQVRTEYSRIGGQPHVVRSDRTRFEP